MKYSVIILLLFLAAVCGCTDGDRSDAGVVKAPGVYVGEKQRRMADLSSEEVFLVVNGKRLRKKDFLDEEAAYDKMLRMGHGEPLWGFNAKAVEALQRLGPRISTGMMRRELITKFAAERGVTAQDSQIEVVASALLAGIKRGDATLDSVCEEMGTEAGKKFRQMVVAEALDMALRDSYDKDGILSISEEDVLAVSNKYERGLVISAEKNSAAKDALNKAIAELKAGADFTETALKYSDSQYPKDEAVGWDEFSNEDLADEAALGEWLRTANKGDISGILDLDDGYAVVKVLDKHLDSCSPDGEDMVEMVWELGRIHRIAYDSLPEMTHDEIVEALQKERAVKIQKLIGDDIMKNAVIEWPNGTNLFDKVSSK